MSLSAIRSVDYVVLLCDDMQAMRRFYEGTLGFRVHRDWPGWLELRVGSTILALRHRGRPYDGAGPEGAGVQLAFRVQPDEVDACHSELVGLGVEIVDPPTTADYGHRTVFFRDPERNVLEIYADV
jgi:catechol 2,3-dioxygenase-like lactoylglutathione lyase family enzyme